MNTHPETARSSFETLVEKNVEAIRSIEQAQNDARNKADILSDTIAAFCGTHLFVYVHCIAFGVWLVWNAVAAVPRGLRFDPPPFNMLTLVVSLEAIFLSTFILISQNRQQRIADERNHLDLQINLLAEQESSLVLSMLQQMMHHMDIPFKNGQDVAALQQATDPAAVAEKIESDIQKTDGTAGGGKGK